MADSLVIDIGQPPAAAILFAQSGNGLVSGTTSESTLVAAAGNGSMILPAGFLKPGRTVKLKAWGQIDTNTVTPTLTIRTRIGGIGGAIISTTGAQTVTSDPALRTWVYESEFTCKTAGATGTVRCHSRFMFWLTATTSIAWADSGAGDIDVDTTIAREVVPTAQWSAADANNLLTCPVLTMVAY